MLGRSYPAFARSIVSEMHSDTAAQCGFFCLQVVQLHVGEEMQPGTIERGAEETRGECPRARPQRLISLFPRKSLLSEEEQLVSYVLRHKQILHFVATAHTERRVYSP